MSWLCLAFYLVLGLSPLWWGSAVAFAEQRDAPLAEGLKTLWDDSIYLVTAPVRMTSREALAVGGVLTGLAGLMAADHDIRHGVQNNTTATGLDVAEAFNVLGSPGAVLGLNAGLFVIGATNQSHTGDSRLKDAALVSLESEIFAMGAVFVVRQVVGRARPDQGKGTSHFSPFSGDDSFPSGHAAASFATAAVFADRFEQPVPVIAYGLASAVALARIYTDKHFTSDVVAGSVLGWVIGKALSARHRRADSAFDIRPLVLDYSPSPTVGLMVVKSF